MNGKSIPTTPEGKFAQEVQRLIDEALRLRRFVVPTLTADPPETDPTNLWMRYDGRLRGRYWNGSSYTYVDYPMRTDITSPPAVPAYPAAPTIDAAPQSYVGVWDALWSQTYNGTGAKRTDPIGEQNLAFGQDPGQVHGQMKSLVGYDSASMVSELTGSTIQKVEVTLTMAATYYDSAEPFFGMHNLSSEPATYDPTGALLRYGFSEPFVVGELKTVSLPLSFGQLFRSGAAQGLVLEVPGADRGLYGYVAGVGSGISAPQITITYAK